MEGAARAAVQRPHAAHRQLDYPWYDTPNIHLCTIKDFVQLCDEIDAKMDKAVALNAYGRKLGVSLPNFAQNLFGEQAVFVLSR